jgi:parallel beta-helix repeat protein
VLTKRILLAVVVGFAAPAFAADGAFEINQTCVAMGCFPGDTPGFPVTTGTNGRYVLTGDLVLESANTDGVVLNEGSTLDLGGFAIQGPISCTGGPPVCTGDGNGFGVLAYSRTTVRNGAVRGMRIGVDIVGRGHLVENLAVENNGSAGIGGVGEAAIIRGCRVARNGQGGILLSNAHGVLISGNTVTYNAGAGGVNFSGDGGLVERNTIVGNVGGSGLSVGATVGFVGNVLTGNGTGGNQTSGGIQIGANVCGNDTVCP